MTLICTIKHSDLEQQRSRQSKKEHPGTRKNNNFFFSLLQCRERSIKPVLDVSVWYIVYVYFIIMAITTMIASSLALKHLNP